MTPSTTSARQRPSDVHNRRTRTQPRQRIRSLPLAVIERAALTDMGRKRTTNQDSFHMGTQLFAVADGVGGGNAGDVASKLAVGALAVGEDGVRTKSGLLALAQTAAAAVHGRSGESADLAGMATTLTAALVTEDRLAIAHAGDSRLYRLRGDRFEALTEDHSLIGQLVRDGRLSPEEAAKHPLRSMITRSLGRDPDVDYTVQERIAQAGDVYMICSDGLSGMITEDQAATILRDSESLDDAALRLVRAANAAGGRDNVTVVLFRLGVGAPAALAA